MKKILLPVVALSLMLSQQVYAQDADADKKARTEQAETLLKVSPPQTLVDQVMDGLSKDTRMQFTAEEIKSLKDQIDYPALDKAMKEALVKTFTVEELKVMIQMYGSPTGQSIINKMPDYMREVMPVLGQQVQAKVGELMRKKMEKMNGGAAPQSAAPAEPPAATPAPAEAAPAAPAAPAAATTPAPAEAKPAMAPAASAPTPAPTPAPAK